MARSEKEKVKHMAKTSKEVIQVIYAQEKAACYNGSKGNQVLQPQHGQ